MCLADALPGEGGESDGAKGAVLITEASQADDRIELRNMSEDSVDMDGWAVQDGDRSASKTWRFPDGTRLEPGERMVLIKGQHHAFGLGKADGVVLLDASGGVVDETTWPEGAAFPSWCRQPDDDDDFTTCSRASFGDGNPSLDEEDPQPEDLVAPKVVSSGNAEFVIDTPDELGFDSQGRLWVGVPPRREIVVLDTKGAVVATVGGPGTGPGEFEDDGGSGGPHAIRAFGDRVYATDRTGGRVNVYDANRLEAVGELVPPDFSDPKGLAIDRQGRIWVSDQGSDQVARMLPDGTVDTVIAPMEDAKLEDFSGDACRTPCNAETVALD